MNFNYLKLLAWVTQSLAPGELIGKNLTSADFEHWNEVIKTEGSVWKLAISAYLLGTEDEIRKDNWLRTRQLQLVMLSNQLNRYLFKEQKLWLNHPQAKQIKLYYERGLTCVEELLRFAELQYPGYYDLTVKITDFRLRNVLPALRHLAFDLKIFLGTKNIDPKLVNLINKGIHGILMPGKLSNAGAKYLKHLIDKIENLPNLDQDSLIKLLINLNFNQPEFYLFQANAMTKRLQQIDGLHEELEHVLYLKEDLLNSETVAYSLHPEHTSLKLDLEQYYIEKINYLKELLLLRRTAMQDKYDSEHAFRILVGMSVPQLALFVRVLKEKEIILREGITEILTFFSRHFYTDKALFISSHNLLKRSSDVDFATVLKLWDMLEGMMNWLDEKFHVRNYERSAG